MSGSGATTGGFQLAYHWEHDDASRIVRMETPDGFTDFDYDDTDQLIGADHEYTTGDNLLTDEIHEWDANGNPDDSTVLDRQIIMDDHNRLRYVYTENSTKVQIYSYDNDGGLLNCRRQEGPQISRASGKYHTTNCHWIYTNICSSSSRNRGDCTTRKST